MDSFTGIEKIEYTDDDESGRSSILGVQRKPMVPHVPARRHIAPEEQMREMLARRDPMRLKSVMLDQRGAPVAPAVQRENAPLPVEPDVAQGGRVPEVFVPPVEIPPPFWAYVKREGVIGVTDGIVFAGSFAEYNCQAFESDVSGYAHCAVTCSISVDTGTGTFSIFGLPSMNVVDWPASVNNVYGTENSITPAHYSETEGHKPTATGHGLQGTQNVVQVLIAEIWIENGKIYKLRRRWNGGDLYIPVTAIRYEDDTPTQDTPIWKFEASLMNCVPMFEGTASAPLSFEQEDSYEGSEIVGGYTEQQMAPRF